MLKGMVFTAGRASWTKDSIARSSAYRNSGNCPRSHAVISRRYRLVFSRASTTNAKPIGRPATMSSRALSVCTQVNSERSSMVSRGVTASPYARRRTSRIWCKHLERPRAAGHYVIVSEASHNHDNFLKTKGIVAMEGCRLAKGCG